MKSWITALALLGGTSLGVVGCSDDSPLAPNELAPPTEVTMVTGETSIILNWADSPFAGSGDFAGYHVYVDTTSIAAVDSSNASFLDARRVTNTPVTGRTFTVTALQNGTSLQKGKKYFLHVRAVRDDDRVSLASNEVNTAPRPEDTNEVGDPTLLMFDYSANTDSRSAYGWDRGDGDGLAHQTTQTNQDVIDFFMVEETNSADDGSEFVSPAQASFTSGWSVRNRTLFRDLGSGDSAWETAIAPDTTSMTTRVKVEDDHTYALRLHDGHWAKLRVLELDKNIDVAATGGGTVKLNRVEFRHAFQLIPNYGRFKPGTRD